MLQKKIIDSEAVVKKLTAELEVAEDTIRVLKVDLEASQKESKYFESEISSEKRLTANERNATVAVAIELGSYKRKLQASDSHAGNCEEVIERLTGAVAREQKKVEQKEDVIDSLKESLAKSIERFERSQEKVAELESLVVVTSEELGLVRRAAKDSTLFASSLGGVISENKTRAEEAEKESTRVAATLDKYRNDLLECEKKVDVEKAKVVKLQEEVKVEKRKVGELHAVITQQQSDLKKVLEIEHQAERDSENSKKEKEMIALTLYEAKKKTKAAEIELQPWVEASDRYMRQVAALEEQLKDKDVVIEKLKKDVAKNLKRAVAAEAVNTGHEAKVAELEDVAALAQRGDTEASKTTTKMAARLYESQKKIPPLEAEVAVYKDQVIRVLEEMEKLKAKLPSKDKEIKKLTKELSSAKQESRDWQTQIAGVEAKITPLNDKLMYTQAQLREEEALKKEMAKQLHANRKRLAEAEDQSKELTDHVQRLIDQLGAEGREPDPKSPKSPKSPSSELGFLKRVNALKYEDNGGKMNATKLMKAGASLPSLITK